MFPCHRLLFPFVTALTSSNRVAHLSQYAWLCPLPENGSLSNLQVLTQAEDKLVDKPADNQVEKLGDKQAGKPVGRLADKAADKLVGMQAVLHIDASREEGGHTRNDGVHRSPQTPSAPAGGGRAQLHARQQSSAPDAAWSGTIAPCPPFLACSWW